MENHGTEYATRFKRLEEQVAALKAIWTQDEAAYHGRFVNFDPMWCWPKPATKPHPPIYFGGESEHTLKRIVALGDGWLPRVRDPDKVLRGVTRLHELAREAGRDPASIGISAFGLPAREEAIAPFREAGIERAILAVTAGPADDMLRRLDRYAELVGS
jgi:alkanesulfonate monooxygenase SsuD/methylene tetrahydromethanopterin reductase-like flavin-dependent oxidoreductase (luciferase family)